jgi:hypothetical protein
VAVLSKRPVRKSSHNKTHDTPRGFFASMVSEVAKIDDMTKSPFWGSIFGVTP